MAKLLDHQDVHPTLGVYAHWFEAAMVDLAAASCAPRGEQMVIVGTGPSPPS